MQVISINASAVAYALGLLSTTHEKLLGQGFIGTKCPADRDAAFFPYTSQCKPAAVFACYESATGYIVSVHLCHVVSSAHSGHLCECGAPLNGFKVQQQNLPFALVGIIGRQSYMGFFKTHLLTTIMDTGTFEIIKEMETPYILSLACYKRSRERLLTVGESSSPTHTGTLCNVKSFLVCAGCNKRVEEVGSKVCGGCAQNVRTVAGRRPTSRSVPTRRSSMYESILRTLLHAAWGECMSAARCGLPCAHGTYHACRHCVAGSKGARCACARSLLAPIHAPSLGRCCAGFCCAGVGARHLWHQAGVGGERCALLVGEAAHR